MKKLCKHCVFAEKVFPNGEDTPDGNWYCRATGEMRGDDSTPLVPLWEDCDWIMYERTPEQLHEMRVAHGKRLAALNKERRKLNAYAPEEERVPMMVAKRDRNILKAYAKQCGTTVIKLIGKLASDCALEMGAENYKSKEAAYAKRLEEANA